MWNTSGLGFWSQHLRSCLVKPPSPGFDDAGASAAEIQSPSKIYPKAFLGPNEMRFWSKNNFTELKTLMELLTSNKKKRLKLLTVIVLASRMSSWMSSWDMLQLSFWFRGLEFPWLWSRLCTRPAQNWKNMTFCSASVALNTWQVCDSRINRLFCTCLKDAFVKTALFIVFSGWNTQAVLVCSIGSIMFHPFFGFALWSIKTISSSGISMWIQYITLLYVPDVSQSQFYTIVGTCQYYIHGWFMGQCANYRYHTLSTRIFPVCILDDIILLPY